MMRVDRTLSGMAKGIVVLIIAVMLLIAACTSTSPEATRGGLAVVDGDGNVAVVSPDGSKVTQATDDATAADPYFQPVWSRDGSMIAYSRLTGNPTLFVTFADGSSTAEIATESSSFYYSWSADNELGFLRNTTIGLTLDLTSLEGSRLSQPRSIAAGAPLYFSWEPEGSRLVTHISLDRLELSDLAESSDLGVVPGSFQAPQWTKRGIVAVERFSGSPRLVLVSPDGAVEPVAELPGPAVFSATPDGGEVAVQSVTEPGGALSALYQALPTIPPNRLVVVSPDDGVVTPVSKDLVGAFFWSPDGTRLLVLDVVSGSEARWSVWDGDALAETVRFQPPASFVSTFLPFFDQYAQSMALWSPDSSAFAFPGSIDGEDGIWVQQLGGARKLVSAGSWVAWSGS